MVDFPILSFALWFPIIGGFIVLLCGFLFEKIQVITIKLLSLSVSFVSLILSSLPLVFFEPAYVEMQFVEKTVWIKDFGINYFLGIDGISIFFLPLTSLITLIVIPIFLKSKKRLSAKFNWAAFVIPYAPDVGQPL